MEWLQGEYVPSRPFGYVPRDVEGAAAATPRVRQNLARAEKQNGGASDDDAFAMPTDQPGVVVVVVVVVIAEVVVVVVVVARDAASLAPRAPLLRLAWMAYPGAGCKGQEESGGKVIKSSLFSRKSEILQNMEKIE